MSPKKPGLTFAEHDKLGLELQTMRDRLIQISTQLSQAYPLKVSANISKTLKLIDRLRSDLDNLVCMENPTIKDALKVYYRAGRSDYTPPE